MKVTGKSYSIGFIVGSGDENRGIYDYTNNKWLFYTDDSDSYIIKWASKGSATKPVYFDSAGKPVACTCSLNKTVPSNAVFTDTAAGKTFKTLTGKSTSGWTNNATDDKIIPTMSFIAYWNGAYSGTSSNLTYCVQGTIIGSNNIGSQSVNYATSAGSATSATTATKLGTIDVGAATRPIYLKAGTPTNCTWETSAGTGTTAYYLTGVTGSTGGINYNSNVYIKSNAIYATSGFYESSDERLKNFGEKVSVDLGKLSKLKKNYFTWKDSENKELQIGVSAQEIRKLYPEIVSE
jgi:hypothetical protein